ncbi:MAG: NADH-quinone oxidoreductase subunit H [Desulfobacterales bacterium]|nr:NADH-quinone oxidoreductase subunit H [Desulfobacterales bacterium]
MVASNRVAGGDPVINIVWAVSSFILVAPVVGGLVAGIDRKITAHMQGRVGPSILQPFYDVGKLFEKEQTVVNETQSFYAICYFIFMIFTGALFFAGGDLLLVIFALTLAQIFLVLGAFAANSPYSHVGAERELLQIMAYEPMVILTAVGMFVATKSFNVERYRFNHDTCCPSHPGYLPWFPLCADHQAAQITVRYLNIAPCPPGDCQRCDHRILRPITRA